MRSKHNRLLFFSSVMIMALLFLFIAPDFAEARRGGRSFGGKRSFSRKSTKPRTARKPSRNRMTRSKTNLPPAKRTSFGGNRLKSSQAYTQKYGVPRKQTNYTGKNAAGNSQRYIMHNYGGYGSGLMNGYLMGSTSWMWMMPFHPAFYYSRPYYVNNPDGTMGVYPPRFSFSKLLFTLIIVGGIAWIIYRVLRNKKAKQSRAYQQSSFT